MISSQGSNMTNTRLRLTGGNWCYNPLTDTIILHDAAYDIVCFQHMKSLVILFCLAKHYACLIATTVRGKGI